MSTVGLWVCGWLAMVLYVVHCSLFLPHSLLSFVLPRKQRWTAKDKGRSNPAINIFVLGTHCASMTSADFQASSRITHASAPTDGDRRM